MALERKIQDLLGRRNELAERLANLESMKGETNQRVYSRIKADYDGQLNEVLNNLGAEKAHLKTRSTTSPPRSTSWKETPERIRSRGRAPDQG